MIPTGGGVHTDLNSAKRVADDFIAFNDIIIIAEVDNIKIDAFGIVANDDLKVTQYHTQFGNEFVTYTFPEPHTIAKEKPQLRSNLLRGIWAQNESKSAEENTQAASTSFKK